VIFSGRLKTPSGLAGNQNLPFMDGPERWLEEAPALVSGFIRSSPGVSKPTAGGKSCLSGRINLLRLGNDNTIHFEARQKNDDR
jgi:hypothetical protein